MDTSDLILVWDQYDQMMMSVRDKVKLLQCYRKVMVYQLVHLTIWTGVYLKTCMQRSPACLLHVECLSAAKYLLVHWAVETTVLESEENAHSGLETSTHNVQYNFPRDVLVRLYGTFDTLAL